jgi:hypothetical protein
MRQVGGLGIGFPFLQQAAESEKARQFIDKPIRTWDLPGVGLWHGITLRLAAIPDEGYSRSVFLLILVAVLSTKSRSFACCSRTSTL